MTNGGRTKSIEQACAGKNKRACADGHHMGRTIRVLLYPVNQRIILRGITDRTTRHEQDVCLRAIGEGVVWHYLLAKRSRDGALLLRHAEHFEARAAESLPWSGVVDNFCAVEQKHRDASRFRLWRIRLRDKSHAAARTCSRFVEGLAVIGAATCRADIGLAFRR